MRKNFLHKLTIVVLLFFLLPGLTVAVTEEQQTGTMLPKEQSQVDYFLPYPGLLPDSPLYFLKILRDRAVGFLISDPLKKADFAILQGDKRLQGGIFLLQKDKTKEKLAITSMLKGENYMVDAIGFIQDAKILRKDTNTIIQKMQLSTKKHVEVIITLQKQLSAKEKNLLNPVLKKAIENEKKASAIKLKK